jgi:hypothetical protein
MDDYKKLFDDVAGLLHEKGYGLVVDQVNEELSTGRLTEEKIKTLKEVESHSSSPWNSNEFRKGQAADFIRRQDYSDAEALVLLLEAAKRAIVDSTVMVADIHSVLADFDIQGVVLEPERTDLGQSIDLREDVDRKQAEEHANLINQITRPIQRS